MFFGNLLAHHRLGSRPHLKGRPRDDEHPRSEPARDDESTRVDGPPIRCKACGHAVTARSAARSIDGHTDHVRSNPHGFVFHIRCFSRAPGAVAVGPSTSDHTWFTGFAWRVALCTRCRTHLGWRFSATDDGFFGLIAARLTAG